MPPARSSPGSCSSRRITAICMNSSTRSKRRSMRSAKMSSAPARRHSTVTTPRIGERHPNRLGISARASNGQTRPPTDRPPRNGHVAPHVALFRKAARTDRALTGGTAAGIGDPAGALAFLLAFRAADPGAARGLVRDGLRRRDHRRADPGLPRPRRLARLLDRARGDLARGRRAIAVDGGTVSGVPPGGAFRTADRRQSDAGPGPDESGALAKPLACRAAGLDLFAELFLWEQLSARR